MRTHFTVVVLLFSVLVFAGCSDDGATPDGPAPPADSVDVSQDPAMTEILGILADYRLRAVVAGLDADDVLASLASTEPHALSRRIGYTEDEIAARDARMLAAVGDLRARFPEARASGGFGDDAAALAAWLDGEPSIAMARRPVYVWCEMAGLVDAVVSCFGSEQPFTDAMYSCVFQAVCNNCTGFGLDC